MNNYLFKPKYSNIDGAPTSSYLDSLKAKLKKLKEVDYPLAERNLAQSESDLRFNISAVNAGAMDPRNVEVERTKRDNYKKVLDGIREKIDQTEKDIRDEEARLIDLQIAFLREKAKTDPNALVALKDLEAQKAKLSVKRTWLIIGGIVIVIIVVIAGIVVAKRRLNKQ